VGSPDLADREGAWVAMSIKIVTTQPTTFRTPGRVTILTYGEKQLTALSIESPCSVCRAE